MVGYLVFLTISTAIFALFSLGLNLQWGFTGLINFGHVAFMTVGAYTTVLLSLYGVPLIISALIGSLLAAFLGLLIGLSTLRLREDYLGIVTIGVSELVRIFVNNQQLPTPNGLVDGVQGLQSYPLPLTNLVPNPLFKLATVGLLTGVALLCLWRIWAWVKSPQTKKNSRYSFAVRVILGILAGAFIIIIYLTGLTALSDYSRYEKSGLMVTVLVVLTMVFWLLESLVRSPWGRVLKSIREDEQVPRALGKNVFWYKLQAFMLGGAIAGIAGAFFAWQLTTIYPNSFEPITTFNAWIIVILGGASNNAGTLLGAIVFFTYEELTRNFLPQIIPLDEARLAAFRIMVIGFLLMVMMIWRPQGILGKKEELTLGK